MSQSTICPKCECTYSQENPPKILINCSHLLCHQCLLKEIRKLLTMQSAPLIIKEFRGESIHLNSLRLIKKYFLFVWNHNQSKSNKDSLLLKISSLISALTRIKYSLSQAKILKMNRLMKGYKLFRSPKIAIIPISNNFPMR